MNELAWGLLTGFIVGIYVNLVSGRYFRFLDIKADLAHEVFMLRQRFELTELDDSCPDRLWDSTASFINRIFQPAAFRFEFEKQTVAKEQVGKLMNEIINEAYQELQRIKRGSIHDTSNSSPSEMLRTSIMFHFEREKDRYVDRIRAIKCSVRSLVFLESIRWE